MINKIPFNKPALVGKELEYIQQAIKNWHISGDGTFTHKCNLFLEKELGVKKSLLTTSCTHALEMSAILLDIKPGDEVIVPSFTFVSTINAFVLRGAKPVFIDIHPDTLNMDENQLEGLITEKTKAIIPVHYAGVSCEMDIIMNIANKYDISVIEDNAHGLFGKYKDRYLGTFGTFATQSFHETKNFFCGEGGALLINDEHYIERAEIIREKGTNRSKFFRGDVDKYSWVDIGSSYLPSDMLAAFLYAQLEKRELIQVKRKKIWENYYKNLENWTHENGIRLPVVPEHCEQSYHMFYLIMPTPEKRTAFIQHLQKRWINAVFHYLPLHLSEMGKNYGGKIRDCPVTENLSNRLVRLPFYNSLDIKKINFDFFYDF
jgi:dTDP-4-amino-4,6-dideoxygalactose transaminase